MKITFLGLILVVAQFICVSVSAQLAPELRNYFISEASSKEFGLDCDDQDTCITSAEKINCSLNKEKYLCEVQFWFFYPGPKADPDEPVPGAEPDSTEDEPVPPDYDNIQLPGGPGYFRMFYSSVTLK